VSGFRTFRALDPVEPELVGIPKLPLTAAEDLLEILTWRYERARTLLTSNRPVGRLDAGQPGLDRYQRRPSRYVFFVARSYTSPPMPPTTAPTAAPLPPRVSPPITAPAAALPPTIAADLPAERWPR
jgi:hypothetical protein